MLDVPWPVFTFAGTESVKLGARTVSATMAVADSLPDVPVTVRLYCPMVAEVLAINVSVLLPVVGFGAKDAITPLGKPDTDKVTLPENPY